MTDLDALKEDLAYLRERGDLAAALTATTAELHRLIEEVEYLREERAAVVAYLRTTEPTYLCGHTYPSRDAKNTTEKTP